MSLFLMGIDDGHDETKVTYFDGNEYRYQKIKSQIQSGNAEQIVLGDGSKSIFCYETSDGEFSVGNIRESGSTAFDEYPLSPQNRVIVMHSLFLMGLTGDDEVKAYSGLPFKKYYRGRSINKHLVSKKKENLLKGDVISLDDASLPNISRHEVASEAVSAWVDIVYQRDSSGVLQKTDLASERIAIIDIGGRTTDVVVIKDGAVDFDRSNTMDYGSLNIRRHVRDLILDKYDTEPTVEQLNQVMLTKSVTLWGQKIDLSRVINIAKQTVSNKIESEVKHLLRSSSDINRVVFVGGTVNELVGHITNWFPQQEIAEDPSYCNSRGMCKMSELILGKSK